jgi:hypothetical protein
MAEDKKKNPKPPGKPLNLSEEELEQWATITPAVLGDAKADARRRHPALAALLEARAIEEDK